jgi:hypothetical protein
MGWDLLPWVYVSDLFQTRTSYYRLASLNAAQRLFSSFLSLSSFFSVHRRLTPARADFVPSQVTPNLVSALGY